MSELEHLEKGAWAHDPPVNGVPPVPKNGPLNRIFGDVVYVVATPSQHACTRVPHMACKQSEHVVCAEPMDMPFKNAARGFALLPTKQKLGRPRGLVVTPATVEGSAA